MIAKNKVVSLSYCLTNGGGEELDRADRENPFDYLHGSGQIVPGLERALEGMGVGDSKDVTLAPKDGYGELNPALKLKVGRSNFPKDMDIAPGMQFSADVGSGETHVFTVDRVEEEEIYIDGNHPLAGETLNFSVTVLDVREATQEEISHGHSHGEGGHHH
ncbi:MAG: peptidylprolyl isomerase [Nitrospinae bacterium CG11_big_fil_rev_8_21_14_0_20_56_8]|nr:MAG: peptidylprolyl isomerase [Nitrospinae bacterium CG11_big_fil_rev_8_21_14_0_20_56_8]